LANALRISFGTKTENAAVVEELKAFVAGGSQGREAAQ